MNSIKRIICMENITGPNALINTSLTSNQPLKDKTSKSVNMASPILSKLNRRGLALNKLELVYYIFLC